MASLTVCIWYFLCISMTCFFCFCIFVLLISNFCDTQYDPRWDHEIHRNLLAFVLETKPIFHVSVSKIVVVFRISVSKNLVSERSSVSVLENLVSEKSLCSAFGKFDIRKGFSVSVEILVLSHSDQHECILQHMHCIALLSCTK